MTKSPLLAGGLALVATLAACGTNPGNGQPAPGPAGATLFSNAQDLVRAATAKTSQAKSAKMAITESIGGQQLSGQGSGRFDGPNTAMDVTMNVGGDSEEVRVVDETMYLRLPAAASGMVTGGKPWARITPDSPMGKMLSSSLSSGQNDPTQYLQQVQAAGTITRSEQTMLDGQQVSHYWISLDFAKVADKLQSVGIPADQLQKLTSQVQTIPLELWLNRDDLPVQVSEDMSAIMKASGAPASAQTFTATISYSDWGTPVDVQAPPADQVGDLQSS
ncbi:MAG TPA: hypothetical protein VFG87_21290 [Amycolatopsis sp.]|nr:hypothetical protein [Amycolatopsis sp.]